MNYKLNISYDGTAYHGWQKQNNATAVCDVLEQAAQKIFKHPVDITGCSRTDAGVHALDYVCNFKSNLYIPLDRLPLALNTKLPGDIRVTHAEEADEDFNSRYSAHSKTYIYKTCCSNILNPFYRNYAYHFPYNVDVKKMEEAAKHFVGTHDFAGFMTQGSSQKTTVRTVNFLNVTGSGDIVEFEINANAYLYNMVRIISGTLLYVGIGKIKPCDIPDIIKSTDRTRAGITAEPQGLYLKEILY